MNLEDSGYLYLPGLIKQNLSQWRELTHAEFSMRKPGHRISSNPHLASAIVELLQKPDLQAEMRGEWRCVRAIAFNKTPTRNWALGWHQDRTIAVKSRMDTNGFGPWSEKDGITHVEPPFRLLERMVTLRLHLDDTGKDNGALLVAPGSHLNGRIAEGQICETVASRHRISCIAEAGDGWLYATPILHSSGRSVGSSARRVLHLDFPKDHLPAPLEWHGID